MAGKQRGDDEFDDDVRDEFDADVEENDADLEADDVEEPSGRRAKGAAKPATKAKKRDDADLGVIGRLVKFIREVVAELQKVIYPTRKELITYTSVVLVFVVVVMTVVSLLDVGFAKLMFLVFGDKTTS